MQNSIFKTSRPPYGGYGKRFAPADLRAAPAEISAFGAVDDFRSEDLRSEIYPQSGANGAIVEVDTAT